MIKKGLVAVLLAAAVFILTGQSAAALVPYQSYTYSTYTGTALAEPTPAPYVPEKVVEGSSLGVQLYDPEDMCTDSQGNVYIVDAQACMLVVLDANLRLKKVVRSFLVGPDDYDSFNQPSGVFVTASGDIYICDTAKRRIVVLDKNYRFVRQYGDIKSVALGDDFIFLPLKIVVDSQNNFYVVCRNELSGIMQFSANGRFVGFIGSNSVTANPLEQLWKKLMSKKQRSEMVQYVPVEYTNLCLDSDGFIYAVSKSSKLSSPVKRLNLSGGDVLVKNGYVSVTGDINPPGTDEDSQVTSLFCDVAAGSGGDYYVLDQSMGRIFVYNSEGYLYYVFGGLGQQEGTFQVPVSIVRQGDNLLVLDSAQRQITVFKPTRFGSLVMQGDNAYNHGQYTQSAAIWKQVLKLDANYEFAYLELGKVALLQNKDKKAMTDFLRGNYRGNSVVNVGGYNGAFSDYRKELASKLLAPVIIAVVVLAVLLAVRSARRKRKKKNI